MAKKKTEEIFELFQYFQKSLENQPPVEAMREEIRMMNFKIKPLHGDVSFLDFNNNQLIEVLWRLGKLDDFFQKEFGRLRPKQQEIFLGFFHNLHNNLQKKLNQLNLKTKKPTAFDAPILEMEIIKEKLDKRKPN
jgi:hypothetical protein